MMLVFMTSFLFEMSANGKTEIFIVGCFNFIDSYNILTLSLDKIAKRMDVKLRQYVHMKTLDSVIKRKL